MRSWIKLIRIHHWTKNLLVFAPVFFSANLFNEGLFLDSLVMFVSFCVAASGCYIINDILDSKFDKFHPLKNKRPIASNEITVAKALPWGIFFIVGGVLIGFPLGTDSLMILIAYVVLQIFYSSLFKRIAPLDVFCVAVGYLLRVIGGGYSANIPVSPWLFLCVFFLALYISFGKRLGEMKLLEGMEFNFRPVLEQYENHFLFLSIAISGASALVTYTIYVAEKQGYLIYSILPASYGIFRYLQLILKKGNGEPLKIFIHDIQLWIVSLIFIFQITWAVYLK